MIQVGATAKAIYILNYLLNKSCSGTDCSISLTTPELRNFFFHISGRLSRFDSTSEINLKINFRFQIMIYQSKWKNLPFQAEDEKLLKAESH